MEFQIFRNVMGYHGFISNGFNYFDTFYNIQSESRGKIKL